MSRGYSLAARAAVLQVIEEAAEPIGADDIVKRAGYSEVIVRSVLRAARVEGVDRPIRIAIWERVRGKPAARYDAHGDLPDASLPEPLTREETVRRHEERRKLNPLAYASRKERDRNGSPRGRALVLAYLTDQAGGQALSARELAPLLHMSVSAAQKACWGLHDAGDIRRGSWTVRKVGRPTPKYDTRVDQPDVPPPGARTRAERKDDAMQHPESAARIREQNARYARNRTAQRMPLDRPAPAAQPAPAVFDWAPRINWSLTE